MNPLSPFATSNVGVYIGLHIYFNVTNEILIQD